MTAAFVAVLAASLCTASPDEEVARVGDVRITRAAVEERIREGDRSRVTASAALAALIDEALLARDARAQGMQRDPEYARAVERERGRVAARVLFERELASAQVPEDMLRTMYHSTSDSARVNLLRFTTREAAEGAAARLAKGGELFAEAQHTIDPAGARSVAHLVRAQMEPALAEAVFRAARGAIVGPVQLQLGWAVAKVEQVFVGDEAEYKAKRASIVAYARGQVAQQGRMHLLEQLRRKSGVTVDEKFLTSLGKHVEVGPAEMDHVIAVVAGRPLRYRDLLDKFRWIASVGGHTAGPAMKIQIARSEVDDLLLGSAALEKDYGKAPEVIAAQPAIETKVLARLVAERVRSSAPRPSENEIRGYHRSSKSSEPLDELRNDIAARLWAPRQAEKLRAYANALRARTRIVINEAALARVSRSP